MKPETRNQKPNKVTWTPVQDYEAASRLAAQKLFDAIATHLDRKGNAAIGLATGNTMIRPYQLLAKLLNDAGLDLGGLATFNLDEYVDHQGRNVAPDHPLSYHSYMTERLFNLLEPRLGFKLENAFFPDAEDPAGFDARLEARGGLDLQLLGIGFNGHIAFNEPQPESEISTEAFAALPTRVIPLAQQTIETNARLTASGDLTAVPRKAVTMGMRQILAARDILLVACFKEQTVPLRRIKTDRVSVETPASFLLDHPSAEIIYTTDTITL